ncbi:hypothetical protein VTK73DRAFT_6635 [Phialemonium thermophilum]|uniref:Wax synthase domain-containing protein n=1 Tax=Phialemonium thermophilum TaxID=223376 RepID=A0ABR3XVA1_9PEZI
MATSNDIASLAVLRRETLRANYLAAEAAGTLRPFVLPFDLVGTFLLPGLYLCFPHVDRPWLYAARYVVLALAAYLDLLMVVGGGPGGGIPAVSSEGVGTAWAAGLFAAWGFLWALTLLVFTRPQWDAARVEWRRRRREKPGENARRQLPENGKDDVAPVLQINGNGSVTHARRNGAVLKKTSASASATCEEVSRAPDESVAEALAAGYEYYWQAYPADEPFLLRAGWVADISTAFRWPGWNWAISPIPHFEPPKDPHARELVKLDSIPLRTRSGYGRCTTHAAFVRSRLWTITWSYLALDFCSVFMAKDPYFVFGSSPDRPYPLPPSLAAYPVFVTQIWRGVLALLYLWGLLSFIIASDHFCRCIFFSVLHFCSRRPSLDSLSSSSSSSAPSSLNWLRRLAGPRVDLWQYPDIFGSFTAGVLDRGLVGFWGTTWHQTFRSAFSAPMAWLQGRPPVDDQQQRGSSTTGRTSSSLAVVAVTSASAFFAFSQSALLHAAGTYVGAAADEAGYRSSGASGSASVKRTWQFFMLNWLGVTLEAGVTASGLGPLLTRPLGPTWGLRIRRAGRAVFVAAWLLATGWTFVDDLARSGLFVSDFLPVSPFRALGLGMPEDAIWRWGGKSGIHWHVGKHWWESGIAL